MQFSIQHSVFSILLLFSIQYSAFSILHAGIPEPETVFYGKIVNKSDGHEYQLTSGSLSWTLSSQEPGGATVTLTSTIKSLKDGEYSYELYVPHETLAQVTSVPDDVVPLTDDSRRYIHSAIQVNGTTARIVVPAKDFFDVEQLTRALTYRVDLEVTFDAPDTDGDGMPDWWEDLHNLSKYTDDRNGDPDGDNVANLDEYKNGMDPNINNESPTLETTVAIAYESGTVGVMLRTLDSDSSAAQLTYTLDTVPAGSALYLGTVALAATDIFTQQQVDAGEVTLVHTDTTVTQTSFDLTVRDELFPTHAADSGTITVTVTRPTATDGGDALLWLDAGSIAAANGAPLATWPDRSGSANDAAQTKADDRPVFDQNAGDGRPAVAFGGDHRYFDLTANSFPDGPHTVFVLHSAPNQAAEQTLFMDDTVELTITGNTNALGHDSEIRHTESLLNLHGNATVGGAWHITTVVADSANRVLHRNGSWNAAGSDSSAIAPLAPQPALGVYKKKWTEGGTSTFDYYNPLKGSLRETLVFDRVLDGNRRRQIEDYLKSKWFGAVVWDAAAQSAALNQSGTDGTDIMIGGLSDDTLDGGSGNDVLRGGPGGDLLTGGDGNDVFALHSASDGNDVIADFALDRTRSGGEQDIIDLSALFPNPGTNLRSYLNISTDGVNSVLGIDLDGDGSGYSDLTITLLGDALTNGDLPWLLADGIILTGGMRLPAVLDLAVTALTAVEVDGTQAAFAVSVAGDGLPRGLFLPFQMTGNAILGVDYQLQARIYNRGTQSYELVNVTNRVEVSLAPGDSSLAIHVIPTIDAATEGLETVQMTLLPKLGVYELGTVFTSTAMIDDGMPTATIVATTPSADEEGPTDGQFTLTRTGPTDAALAVTVTIQGSAINGNDYQLISSPLTIPAGQATLIVAVHPFADTLSEPLEEVVLALFPGTGYDVGASSQATVTIRDEIPRVAIEALNPVARLAGPVPGVFLVTRSGLLTGSLFVRLNIGGSALNGTDYEYLSAYVMFPPNEAYATIEVMPLAGASIQGAETVEISIASHADYGLGTQTEATVTFDASNEAPVLAPATPNMTGITEDATDNNGMSVASIVGGTITDSDVGAREGIAAFASAPGNGSWAFSLNGGASWAIVGTVSSAQALLLRSTDRIRFVPDTRNGTTASISYYAWDQSDDGLPGTKVEVAIRGGETAFSTASDTASIIVTSVNDAPIVAAIIPDQTAAENAGYEFIFAPDTFQDVDTGDVLSYGATLDDDSPLPAWLTFVPAERRFHGTPGGGDVGTINVKVTAADDDAAPLSTSDIFELNVLPDNPTVAIALAGGQTAFANGLPIVLDVTFSEIVTGFDQADVVLGGTSTVDAFTVTGGNADYQINITTVSVQGTIEVSIPQNAAQDGALKGNFASNTLTVVYDIAAPGPPVITSPADDATANTAQPTISGTAEASGSPEGDTITVEVTSDVDGSLGTAEVDELGAWTLTPAQPMAQGAHLLTAIATDKADNASGISASVTVRIYLDPFAEPPQSNQICHVWGDVELNGLPVSEGCVVAVFSPRDGIVPCGKGTVAAGGSYGFIAVFGYDNFADGLPRAGDPLTFKVWDPQTGTTYTAKTDPANVTWTANNGVIEVDLILGAFEISLHQGWNLVGWNVNKCWYAGPTAGDQPTCALIPGQPKTYVGSDTVADAAPLQQIAGKYSQVTSFDCEGGHLFDVTLPAVATLKYVAGGYGYWLHMDTASTLSVHGARIPTDTQIDLKTGWQLLTNWTSKCYYVAGKVDPQTLTLPAGVELVPVTNINEIFGSPTSRVRVTGHDSGGGKLYDNQLPEGANSLHYISPGYGYWIYVESDLLDFAWP